MQNIFGDLFYPCQMRGTLSQTDVIHTYHVNYYADRNAPI